MTDIEKIKLAIERNQSQFVRTCEYCYEHECGNCPEKNYYVLIDDALKGMVDNNISIDAVPVAHAHWIFVDDYTSICSNCQIEMPIDHEKEFDFCPNCGARMDEVE